MQNTSDIIIQYFTVRLQFYPRACCPEKGEFNTHSMLARILLVCDIEFAIFFSSGDSFGYFAKHLYRVYFMQ